MNSQTDNAHVLALASVEARQTEPTLGDQQAEAAAAAFVADRMPELENLPANAAGGFRVTWISNCLDCGQEAFEQTAALFGKFLVDIRPVLCMWNQV